MVDIAVYPREGTTYPDASGVLVTSVGAIVYTSKYIRDALRAGFLLTGDPLGIYQPEDRTGGSSSGGDGLAFSSISALGAYITATSGSVATTTGFATAGDGGGGTWYWSAGDDTAADNGLIVGASPLGRWRRIWDGVSVQAAWFGLKADVVQATDATVTSGSAVVASTSLSSAAVGKKYLLRTPSSPVGGTASKATGNNVMTGSGSTWLTTLSTPGAPTYGTGICSVGGEYLCFEAINSDTVISLLQLPATTASGQVVYRDVQTKGTVATASTGTCTLDSVAVASEANAWLTFGTDDSAVLQAAIEAAIAAGAAELVLPSGKIGISQNIGVTAAVNFTIRGAGMNETILVDLRRASEETPYDNSDYYFGALSGLYCNGLTFRDMSYDGSVPRQAMAHSTGGVPNTSGARIGFFMRHCQNSSCIRLGSAGIGARDEHVYADGNSPNFVARECVMRNTNNNSINVGFTSKGCQISDNIVNSYYSCIQATGGSILIANNECSQDADALSIGASMIVLDSRGKQKFTGNICRSSDTSRYSVGIVEVYGGVIADSLVEIENNTVTGIRSGWNQGVSAAFMINDMAGTCVIRGNVVAQCTANTTGGKCVSIFGANTADVTVENNKFTGGNNITQGIVVDATVPTGKVLIGKNDFGASITTRLSGNFTVNSGLTTVIATGTTVVGSGVDNVVVTVNGAVGLTFPNAAACAGKRILVKNASTQAGTTTVTPASSLVDGAASSTLVGANVFKTYLSDGTNWQVT